MYFSEVQSIFKQFGNLHLAFVSGEVLLQQAQPPKAVHVNCCLALGRRLI